MPRYKERQLRLRDIVNRFEAESSSIHVRNALGAIDRLERDGTALWDESSDQLSRWREGYTALSVFLNRLGERRHVKGQDLATALREFIQEFEHTTARMLQMLHSTSDDPDNDTNIERILRWFDLIYRLSTYALISSWIDDKTEKDSLKMTVNLTTGTTTAERTREKMRIPKQYRRSTRTI